MGEIARPRAQAELRSQEDFGLQADPLPPITRVIEARAALALRRRISAALGEHEVLELSEPLDQSEPSAGSVAAVRPPTLLRATDTSASWIAELEQSLARTRSLEELGEPQSADAANAAGGRQVRSAGAEDNDEEDDAEVMAALLHRPASAGARDHALPHGILIVAMSALLVGVVGGASWLLASEELRTALTALKDWVGSLSTVASR
jgi:hypothetical protein